MQAGRHAVRCFPVLMLFHNRRCGPHSCRHAGPAITNADTAEDRSEFKLRFYRVG